MREGGGTEGVRGVCVSVCVCAAMCDPVKVYVWTQRGKRGGMLREHSD